MGPVRQNPIQRTVRSVHVCAVHWVQVLLHTILHRTDLIIFPLALQTINHHCSDDVYLRERGLSQLLQTWQCADVWVTIHLSNSGLGNSRARNRVSRVRVRVSLRVLGPGLWLGSVTQTSGDHQCDTRMTITDTTCKACITCQANRQHNMYKQM